MYDAPVPTPSFPTTSQQWLLRLLSIGACLLFIGCASPSGPRQGGGLGPVMGGTSTLTAEQSNSIAIHALGLVGTPYRYGGNTPDGGFDCSGLIGYVYLNSVGESPPRTVARMTGFGAPVPMSELRTGDLVLFGSSTPSHAGIYVGNGRFVHAPSTGGVVRLDRLDGVYWSRQVVQARRP
ncbi:cell wall-associated NlpC family hydrolase [Variovorax sp. SG517]|uniref:C40 family peptidase n=1 Tax=Variovorax sp. SG517 TaxID=2587117 RepID=UPI00159D38FD|nr:C40 family peptidase [Variovorax sp. SG517]NVM86659.1 cell wall-associated NlpC family hydrolase [Variovorax sp. SG517]